MKFSSKMMLQIFFIDDNFSTLITQLSTHLKTYFDKRKHLIIYLNELSAILNLMIKIFYMNAYYECDIISFYLSVQN